MSKAWFAANNVERTYRILSSINLLSINAKLKLLKSENPINAEEVIQSQEDLLGFVSELTELLEKAENRDSRTILGTDPQMGQLATRFRDEIAQRSPAKGFSGLMLAELPSLIVTEDEGRISMFIDYLDRLRFLIEQYSYSDMVTIFGEGWS